MGKQKILVIEDEKSILELLKYNLERENYQVDLSSKGDEGLDMALSKKPDLILLDLMLPEIDGIEICKTLRNNPKTKQIPIIMLTAKSEETDKVLGLELGADDYMTKPFSPRELVARVKAVLRRSGEKDRSGHEEIVIGTIKLDFERHIVTLKDEVINLTSKEFQLLLALMKAKGKVLTRDHLLDDVWGYDAALEIETRTVDMHITQLRKKLQDEAKRIVTVKNVGYRLDIE